jgi:hypothetical protein
MTNLDRQEHACILGFPFGEGVLDRVRSSLQSYGTQSVSRRTAYNPVALVDRSAQISALQIALHFHGWRSIDMSTMTTMNGIFVTSTRTYFSFLAEAHTLFGC